MNKENKEDQHMSANTCAELDSAARLPELTRWQS